MSKDPVTTRVQPDGLRYKSKAPGSPFAPSGVTGPATMSCFLCGKHRPRSLLKTRKLLGKAQYVCDPNCAAVAAGATAPQPAPQATPED